MKKREKLLSKKVLALGLTSALLGSVGYVLPAAAATITVETTEQYNNLGSNEKDSISNVVPVGSYTNNEVTIGTVGGGENNPLIGSSDYVQMVYGGFAAGSTEVSNNKVTVYSGKMGNVAGGYGNGSGNVTGNIVTISGSSSTKDVRGGYSGSGNVTGNIVTISGGMVSNDAFGGYGRGEGLVEGNSVTISGGTVAGNAYGGKSNSGIAEKNHITISGGTVTKAVYGGYSSTGLVTGNTATISDGNFTGGIYGGGSYTGDVTGNKVTISGGTVAGDVCGGYGNKSDYTGNINNNSITISSEGGSKPTFNANTVLYGWFIKDGGASAQTSGNTLNIKTSGLTVKNVANFDTYNFYLQSDTTTNDVLLTLTDANGTDISNSSVNVGMAGSANVLQVGDSVTLMKNENTITANNVAYGKITQGVSLIYDFTTALSEDGKELVTTISEAATVSTDTKSPVETQVAAAAFLSSGADLLAGQGIASAVAVAGTGQADIFGAMGGGNMRYKSGSYADVHGWNLALGVGKAVANNSGKLTFGPFVEYGRGNYTSHLDSGVRGDGTTKYYGLGVLARQDNKSGVYYEGSLRYGRLDSDYASNDMGAAGVRSSYETSSAYYGAHLALGKITKLNDKVYADIYTKLMYNHQGGDSVALGGEGNGEVYSFDSVNSTRVRAGIRLSKDYNVHNTAYAGVAYEHEFDSEARATVKGLSTPAPSIKGSSGMLELGYILQPKGANDMSIDIGLQGWAGKKQGVSGSVNFVWTF